MDPETEEIEVTCTWKSYHTVTVPKGYRIGHTLDGEWADQVDASTAELVDWE